MNTSSKTLPAIAFVYLLADGDDRNKCLLTEDEIVLVRKGKVSTFKLESVKELHFSSKLFLLPLLVGGTFGPFSFIAIINNSFHPVISLVGFLISLLAFYYGISGKKSFVIETKNDRKEIFLPAISDNLKEFSRFINRIIQGDKKEDILTFYVKTSENRIKKAEISGRLSFDKNGEWLFLKDEVNTPGKDEISIPVNYTNPTTQIKFVKTFDNKLRPKIFGYLNMDGDFISSIRQ